MRPMLAEKVKDVSKLTFPLYASPKIDGVRVLIQHARPLSRTLKVIPNKYVQEQLGHQDITGLDGEITVGLPNARNVMQATTSGVMTRTGQPDFTLWVFDFWTAPETAFTERYRLMQHGFKDGAMSHHPRIKLLQQTLIRDEAELIGYERARLAEGFEGVMIRSINGFYKYGRSTNKEGWLLKLKRFTDAEAVVIGFEEKMHNTNEATTDERGYTKRSSHSTGMVPMGTLGAFKVRTSEGVEFSVGTGLTDAQRAYYWNARDTYIGKQLTYKFFDNGIKEAPRFPVFKAFRHESDIGEAK